MFKTIQITSPLQNFLNLVIKSSQYLQKNFTCLIRDPKFFTMRKLARFEMIRNLMSNIFNESSKSNKISKNTQSIFENISVEQVIDTLENEGYCLDINLPQNTVKELLKFAHSAICYGDRNLDFGFKYSEK